MLHKSIPKDWVSVAKIGRSLGFKGDVILHLLSDFPESLKCGNTYHSHFGDLTLEHYSPQKSTAKFKEINSKEEAKGITNLILYATQEQCKEQCKLGKEEFFWFEIVGSEIVEKGEVLGVVGEIERFCGQDYLSIKTASALVAQNLPKSFLIPYTARYILEVESAQPLQVELEADSTQSLKGDFKRGFKQDSAWDSKLKTDSTKDLDSKTESPNPAPKIIHTQFCKEILENS